MADEIELKVLTGIYKEPSFLDRLSKVGFSSNLFFDKDLKIILDAISWQYSQRKQDKIDSLLLKSYLEEQKALANPVVEILQTLERSDPLELSAVIEFVDVLKLRFSKRSLKDVSDKIGQFIEKGKDHKDLVDFTGGVIESLQDVIRINTKKRILPIREALIGFTDELKARTTEGSDIIGFSLSPYNYLNKTLSGMRQGFYYALAGAPRRGKTNVMLRLATILASNEKIPVLYYSWEQTSRVLLMRVLSQETLINPLILQTKDLKQDIETLSRFNTGLKKVQQFMNYLHLIEGRREDTMERIRGTAYNIMQEYKTDKVAIFLDYIQKIPTASLHTNLQKQVDEVSGDLANLSNELNCPIVAISAFDKEGCRLDSIDSKERPTMFNCVGGGDIEYDADVALVLVKDYNDTAQLDEKISNAIKEGVLNPAKVPHFDILNFHIDKNRDAPEGGNIILQYLFLIEDNQMVEIGYKDPDERYSYAKAGRIYDYLVSKGYLERVGPGDK